MKHGEGLTREDFGFRFAFRAMASPCEIRIDCEDENVAEVAGSVVEAEALRIERKFSRYRDDSIVTLINRSDGKEIRVDGETAQLIDFADATFKTSSGLFDITSGVLRRVWRFDGSDNVPTRAQITPLRRLIGWQKVSWDKPVLRLQKGMEIDLGGLGKEYAVDRALQRLTGYSAAPALINFGGDLRATNSRVNGEPWKVGIESVHNPGMAAGLLVLGAGALATSGDMNRYLIKNGVRYSHILNPRTGRPVADPPRSVTVAATTCVEAGMLATVAMLQGRKAEQFLKAESIQAWCTR